jgi:ankyrin repeat protein
VRRTDPATVAAARGQRPGLVTWAAAQGAPNSVELLVAAGFDVNALGRSDAPIDQPWESALHVAAQRGDCGLAQRLLDLGADRDLRDGRFDGTALDWARHFGQTDLVELLER